MMVLKLEKHEGSILPGTYLPFHIVDSNIITNKEQAVQVLPGEKLPEPPTSSDGWVNITLKTVSGCVQTNYTF